MILERADAMRRLAEAIQRHAAGFLERQGIDFEIRWHGVLRTLEGEGPASVVELARKLGITHPAVHHTVQSLVAEGLVASYRDARDKRRRVLALTRFGRMRLAELADVFRDLDAECRQRFEADLEGIVDNLNSARISIVDYEVDNRLHAERFAALNREWIERYFVMEAADEAVFADPEQYVLGSGGAIVFARREDDQQLIGTCALQLHGPQLGELAKMAVTPAAQGLGAGRLLGEAVIRYARERGVRRLFLDTNSVLKPAIALYKGLGFVELQRDDVSRYARSDTYMELLLGD